jgi:hypothetical protein
MILFLMILFASFNNKIRIPVIPLENTMIEIKTHITCAPEKQGNMTVIRSAKATVRVDKIRLDGRHYMARLTHAEEDAPNDIKGWAPHPVWLFFTKANNLALKIPVLQKGQALEV